MTQSELQKRIKDITELYQNATKNEEDYQSNIFQTLKELNNDNQKDIEIKVVEILYKYFEEVMEITLGHTKIIFKDTYKDNIIINLDDLFYDNGMSLEEKVHQHFEKLKSKDDTLPLFIAIALILITEARSIIKAILRDKSGVDKFIVVGNCDSDCPCAEYCDGEEYILGEDPDPPYHPNCKCIMVPV